MKHKTLLVVLALLLCAVVVVAQEPFDHFVYLPLVVGGVGTAAPTATPTFTPTPTMEPTVTITITAPTMTPTPGTVVLPTVTPAPCGYVSGNIVTSTTWVEDCTYIVTGDVGVPKDVTLTIEPGVSVLFDYLDSEWPTAGTLRMRVVGTIKAVGTETQPISFLPLDATKGWHSIELYGKDSIFDYCIFQRSWAGLDLRAPNLTVTNSVFDDANYAIYAMSYYASDVTISHCHISGASWGIASRIAGSGALTVTHNTITENGIGIRGDLVHGTTHINYNNIHDNLTYNVQAGSADLDAAYNWWGTVNTTEIDAGIYDYEDNVTLGRVLYQPIATTPY